ncbi:MAG: DUF5060 domain-containing protein [Saprospiraceae bacterium]|nr:DUF5060 domain-containing protein [Saprospiraceae bacterium]
MKIFATLALQTLFVLMTFQTANAQAPVITAATPLAVTVEQWGKFEISLDVTAAWSNPYDYDDIRVACTFTAPDGQTTAVDGLFMQEYQITNEQTGAIAPVGNGRFKVRFSPRQTGVWKYALSCTNASGTGTYPEQTFTAVDPSGVNKGFVRNDLSNYLHFDNDEQYIPVGENICWYQSNAYTDYKKWLTQLSDHGGNYFRLWQCHWGLGLEWKNNVGGYAGLRKYKQNPAFYTDWLLDFCAEKGIYVMYCMQHHGQVSSNVNPNWGESPYNLANGGPCANTWDFFTNTAAKNHAKNRFRYMLARWGYSRNIMTWELFNEVDWTDQFDNKKGDVAAWHDEMAAYLAGKDPNKHLISTSFAQDYLEPSVWNQPLIDITQTHYYIETPNLERALANGIRKYLDDFGKPTINGEFGLTTSGTGLSDLDPDGIHLHNSLWGSLFAGAMGAGATWWWDNYVEPKNLYHHFAPVSAVAAKIPFHAGALAPAQGTVTGVPADLVLTPSLGWSALADTSFTIDSDGNLTPANASLSQFLYGSQWNTQYKRPPVFHITHPAGGLFKVKTAAQTGQSPKIAVWLDGVKVLEQNAQINQTYQISIPAGQHTIKVDNTGTDWITVVSYTFAGLGSAVDAYILKSPNQDKIAGWALNNSYNHAYINVNGQPAPASGALLTVQNVKNGAYNARFYDCLTGSLLSTEALTVTGGTLALPLPDVLWDIAFYMDDQPFVAVEEAGRSQDFQLYPNPAAPGAALTLEFETRENAPLAITLLDMEGKAVRSLFSGDTTGGTQQMTIPLPADLAAGVYWVKMETGDGKIGARGVMVE